jgi:serine/threonine-protein kinase HipA
VPVDKCNVLFYPRGRAEPVIAGELRLLPRMAGSVFRYSGEFIRHRSAIALDPFVLPLRNDEVVTHRSGDAIIPEVFQDAGPDAWGRTVIDRALGGLERSSEFDYLLAAGSNRTGALDFSADGKDENALASQLGDLTQIEAAIDRIRKRLPLEDKLRHLVAPGTSLGGVRPKTNVRHEGCFWIAKFNSRDEDFDAVSVEYAGMQLAGLCGLDVPQVRKIDFSDNRVALLVRRFDREALDDGAYGRIPFISARTVLNGYASEVMGETLAEYSYVLLAEALRLIATQNGLLPGLRELFSRMVLNILIDNTDDHERNHGLLHDGRGWTLSPAFDISSQFTALGYQGMGIGARGTEASLENAVSECDRFGLTTDEALDVVKRLIESTSNLTDVYREAGIDGGRVKRIAQYRERVINAFAPKQSTPARVSRKGKTQRRP